ncbi:clathrin associated protein complex large subunit [Yamadazyma tenuis]|uniref:AP-1 complex subunit gamma n=1 Tax=Candida tenuis (strain ATCC 10573 / BCRC 21748 / CBS 615 / JCM 9827 / NBRC 10315 / NRRL Y-1498 / VKM Y-70) TaxID=590646 RepID=G3AWH5_CANTC|nr:uncharacterized protein CANTEDRAFT_117533 [Yamadazyma tenuis ATCC 10573]EGV66541.1 hypothetical protein CANTEDRAFT_117533 [Yamadazyma tenuis ATCC 10573]WEJ95337.1 clathrin associated protein complex large subunit [Yamadazyma tenuis]
MASLKTFIKAVRKAKTIADERNVVKKESASIRTSFKDVNLDQNTRRVNISKLLYLYIIGEKTHFGQVECIKLLASPKFIDKRLGYLATMLLLDENQEVLTLLTNSLDNDMKHTNHYVVAQALCCLGNIASLELSRDLYQNVEKLMQSKNAYLKKKATIVASKLIDKNPDLLEFFVGFIPTLITDKSQGVLLASLKLIQSCFNSVEETDRFNLPNTYTTLIGHLKKLITSGYNPDYDVLGINDPFLIINLISTLRLLSTVPDLPAKNLEMLNDVLTQICSNIEIGKNVNHAVLYECIKTIFSINSDQSLKILGINLLGKFLSTKDNNTKYVALNTLLTVVNIEPNAVQRHRSIIVSCLSDGDISIRRRSLELSFAILNESNIRILIKEIVNYLKTTDDNDLKPYIISQLILSIEKFSPNDNWKFDNLIKVLNYSDNHVQIDYISNILSLVIRLTATDLKKSILLKMFKLNYENDNMNKNKLGLALTTVWCLGEYFELINNEHIEINDEKVLVNDEKVLEYFKILSNNSNYSIGETNQLTSYIINSLIKLSNKFSNNSSLNQIKLLLESHANSSDLEIQIRSVEYLQILTQDSKLRKGLLSKMPAPKLKKKEMLTLNDSTNKRSTPTPKSHSDNRVALENDLLDFNDDVEKKPEVVIKNDLLSDIFSNSKSTSANPRAHNDILDLFDAPTVSHTAPTSVPVAEELIIYTDANIVIKFLPKSVGNGFAQIESHIQSKTSQAITNFQLLIAVPKSQKLTISTNNLVNLVSPSDVIVQNIKLTGKEGSKVKFRIKFNYHLNGKLVEHMFDYSLKQNL